MVNPKLVTQEELKLLFPELKSFKRIEFKIKLEEDIILSFNKKLKKYECKDTTSQKHYFYWLPYDRYFKLFTEYYCSYFNINTNVSFNYLIKTDMTLKSLLRKLKEATSYCELKFPDNSIYNIIIFEK